MRRSQKAGADDSARRYIVDCTKNFGRAKLVLKNNRHHVESDDAKALRTLLSHPDIRAARDDEDLVDEEFAVGEVAAEMAANRAYLELAAELDDDDDDDEGGEAAAAVDAAAPKQTFSFRLRQNTAQDVKRLASTDLDFPLAEEYARAERNTLRRPSR